MPGPALPAAAPGLPAPYRRARRAPPATRRQSTSQRRASLVLLLSKASLSKACLSKALRSQGRLLLLSDRRRMLQIGARKVHLGFCRRPGAEEVCPVEIPEIAAGLIVF